MNHDGYSNGYRSAVDKALSDNNNNNKKRVWKTTIPNILKRQKTLDKLFESLERLVEEPDAPLDLIDYALYRVEEVYRQKEQNMDGQKETTSKAKWKSDNEKLLRSSEMIMCGTRCIFNIWYRILVDRENVIQHSYYHPTKYYAKEALIDEMLELRHCNNDDDDEKRTGRSPSSIKDNPLFQNAFQKSKRIIFHFCKGRGRLGNSFDHIDDDIPSSCSSFVSLVIIHQLPPFLIWLAVLEDPSSSLGRWHGDDDDDDSSAVVRHIKESLPPLYQALDASNMSLYQQQKAYPRNGHEIHFHKEHLPNDSPDGKLLHLFNKTRAVQLLCYLMTTTTTMTKTNITTILQSPPPPPPPSFNERKDPLTRLPHDLLDIFLNSLHVNRERIVDDRNWYCVRNIPELLEDLHTILDKIPHALEFRNPNTGLYPFCMPQLQMSTSSSSLPNPNRPSLSPCRLAEDFRCFFLTLAFELLIRNPTVIRQRHLNDDNTSLGKVVTIHEIATTPTQSKGLKRTTEPPTQAIASISSPIKRSRRESKETRKRS